MTKQQLITILISMFRRYGYDGTTLSMISKQTGLGKASLYHHFPQGKQQMAEEAFAYLKQWREETLLKPLAETDNPLQGITQFCQTLTTHYLKENCHCLLASFLLGDMHEHFQNDVIQAFETLKNALISLLEKADFDHTHAQKQAEFCLIQIQGALILSRGLNNQQLFIDNMEHLPLIMMSK